MGFGAVAVSDQSEDLTPSRQTSISRFRPAWCRGTVGVGGSRYRIYNNCPWHLGAGYRRAKLQACSLAGPSPSLLLPLPRPLLGALPCLSSRPWAAGSRPSETEIGLRRIEDRNATYPFHTSTAEATKFVLLPRTWQQATMSLDAHHVQDVGRILVQVQDQLKSLRSAIREETLQAELGEKLQGARGHHQGLSSSEIESKGSSRSAGGLSSRLEEVCCIRACCFVSGRSLPLNRNSPRLPSWLQL